MRVRPKLAAPSQKQQQNPQAKPKALETGYKLFPAPSRGWILDENLATAQPGGAHVFENWFPTTTGARVRGGTFKRQTISTGAVLSLFNYKSGGTEKFFAADQSNIFDITTITDADTIPGSPAVTGQTAGYYSTQQIGTAGGNYLVCVNGTDDMQQYDGSAWATINSGSTPAITGANTSDLSQVWLYGNRLWFVEEGTMNARYLPVDSRAGALSNFSLAGVFKKGGSLLFGASWSLDAGDGLDDKCVFVSTEGEVAIYEGTDPSNAATWTKAGVYDIGKPLGINGTMQAGGDLLIATYLGLVPLTQAINQDEASLSKTGASRQIFSKWADEVADRTGVQWEILKWPEKSMMIVSLPRVDSTLDAECVVANLETGAWGHFTGIDTRCLGYYAGRGFYGANDGNVYEFERTGSDNGTPYTCVYVGQFDHLDNPGRTKTALQGRATFKSSGDFNYKLSASVNYNVSLPTAPSSGADYTTSTWDNALWDVAQWDQADELTNITSKWSSIGRTGFVHAPQVQITIGITPTPKIELVSTELTHEMGDVVV